MIEKTLIPKGQYSLYTIPKPDKWLLIFNTDLITWPTDPDRKKDFAQVVIPSKRSANIYEQFTIIISETKKGGVLKFRWDDTEALTNFEVVKR